MSTTLRIVVIAIAAFLAFTIYHAFTPWGWTGQGRTPPGVAATYFDYTCGAPWGSAYVHGPASTPFPVQGTPCSQRRSYQYMAGADLLVGGLALAVALGWNRRLALREE